MAYALRVLGRHGGAGPLHVGQLPSTRELAEAYGVHTASRALSLLHDRELITGQPGRGTYVAAREQ